jgi:hypothetical protein
MWGSFTLLINAEGIVSCADSCQRLFYKKGKRSLILLGVKTAQLRCVPRVLLVCSCLEVVKPISSTRYDLLDEVRTFPWWLELLCACLFETKHNVTRFEGSSAYPSAMVVAETLLVYYRMSESYRCTGYRVIVVLAAQLGIPRGRYDEHNDKFSLSMKPRFNRLVGERNHFWRLMLASFGDGSWEYYGTYLGHSFGACCNVEPPHNTTKVLCPNLKWGCQSHRFAVNKGLNVSCGNRCLFARK